MTTRLIKTIRSHAGHARYLSELSEEPVGWLAACDVAHIPSPYAYSPTVALWRHEVTGQTVFVRETAHRVYQIFVPSPKLPIFKSDDEATDWHCKHCGTERKITWTGPQRGQFFIGR